jgi:hypothetical protein
MQANKTDVRPKTKKVRSDPRSRHVEGVRNHLVNPDPNKKYVFVPKGSGEFCVDDYSSMGYDVEKYSPGGVTTSGRTAEKGQPIEYMDNVLMSIDKERADQVEQYGLFDDSGQERADIIEEAMIQKGGVDKLRGLHGNIPGVAGVEYINETKSPERVGSL